MDKTRKFITAILVVCGHKCKNWISKETKVCEEYEAAQHARFWGAFSHAISHLAFTPDLSGRFFIFSSVQFSHSFMSDCLQPHESQHARPPCPSPTPGVYSNSCASSRWYHPTISSSVVPFSCPQSLPASGSFPMSQLFAWGGQSIGVSALLASVLPMKTQDWFPLVLDWFPVMHWLDLLAVQGTHKSLLQHHSSKASILRRSAFFIVQLSYPYMTTGKTIALTRQTFVDKRMSLLFNMLSRLVITFH